MRSWLSHFEQMDWTLLLTAFTLTAIGLVGIYGIGASQDPPQYFLFQKQLAVACIGLVITIGLSFVHFQTMRAYSFLAYIGGAILLAAVLVFGVHIRGTTGWFKVGSLSFQPVEIAKVTLCMYLAAYFSKVAHGKLTWKTFGLSLLPTLGYVGLVMLQPDFGSAMTLLAIWGMMAAFVGLPRRAWVILPIVAMVAIGSVWTVLQPYQRARVTNFLHPELNARGSGYNAIQARIAIGSGGWLGKGVGEGSQARLRFLPEASTDFMIAVVGEEMGFIGMIVILGLYLFLFYRLLRLASEIHHPYASFLLVGIGATFLVHMTVNIGMNLGLLPITGIPLPYISAAASFLLFNCFVSLGIIQSIAARRPISQLMDREQDEIDALAL